MKQIKLIETKDFHLTTGDTVQSTLMNILTIFVLKINELVKAVNFLVDNQK